VLAPTALHTRRLGGRPGSGYLGDRCTARRRVVPIVGCPYVAHRPIAGRPSLRSQARPRRRGRAAPLVPARIPRRRVCVGRSTPRAIVLGGTPLARWRGRRRDIARRARAGPRLGAGERRGRAGQSEPGDRMCVRLCRRVRAARDRCAPSASMLSTTRSGDPLVAWPAGRGVWLPRARRERFGGLEHSREAAVAGQDLHWRGAVEVRRGRGGPNRQRQRAAGVGGDQLL
jgi:hypothetical protein